MAKFHGKEGSVSITGIDPLKVRSFTIDIASDTAEVTDMSSTGDWKEYLAGCKGWTVSVEALADSTGYDIAVIGTLISSAVFTLISGTTLTGDVIVTGISGTQGVDSEATVTYELQGTGALA